MIKSILFVSLLLAGGSSWAVAQTDGNLQTMTLSELYTLADQKSQKVKVSEVALQAADEGIEAAKSAMLPTVDLSLQGSYTGNAFMLSRGFSTSGTTDYIVPGMGSIPVEIGRAHV